MIRPGSVVVAAVMLMGLTSGLSAQTIGVAACDDFLTKYDACLGSKVPEAQRAMYKASVDQMRKTWTDTAKNPSFKSALESSCKAGVEQLKTALSTSFGCTF
jgi:hypothetical protein